MIAPRFIAACAIALLLAGPAFALKTDKQQISDLEANYQKSVQSKTGQANDPDVSDYDGDVVVTQGSIKMTSTHATVWRIPSAANDPNAGQTSRILLTGKQAHLQQVHDGDCALMTANADKIDYDPLTSIAILTGGVVVVQQGRGTFTGEHVIYNTDTGDMESGDKTSTSQRVHTVMEPKTAAPPPSTNNCGFPAASAAKAAPPVTKPAAPAKAPASGNRQH